ncbi:MAG: FG-GAP-like repeat-containing protein, partial [Candidatus Marinimicrobia bacterium]|nr:FG-GAP-like repeat-containing protein [Candidatus Neomarinimicrobiota bacterium]
DLDADGDQDIIMSGWNKIQGKLVTWILRNEPLGSFSLIPDQIDFAVAYGTIDAIDYNLDGFKDFVIAGADSVTFYAGKVHSLSGRVYLNNGDGTFSSIKEIPGARIARFVDVDQDSIPDLIASGTTEIGNDSSTFSQVYLNTTAGVNHPPEAPSALTAFAVSTRAIFTWGAGTDDIDDPASLSYNVRIGTSSGGNQLMSSSVPYNSSSVGQRLIREFNEIPHGTYYWAVQTVDGSGNISNWSQEDTLFIARLVTSTQSLPGVYFSAGGWADYNEDNYLDLALTGVTFSGSSITNIFENSDGLLSQDLNQSIEAAFGGHISWVDYTNDGHLDLSLSGFQIINFFPYRVTKLYRYQDGIYIPDTDSDIYADVNYDGIPDNWVTGGVNGHHWGDYDNDGDLDFLQGGFDNYNMRHLDIFYNDNGILRLDTNQTDLVPIYPALVQWVDVNRDGYLDIVSIGADETQTLGMRVFLNNNSYVLTSGITWNSNIYGVTAGAIAFADYNSDGYDDFALTGLNSSQELITYIVANSINQFTVQYILQGVYYGKPAWGDYDADGDLDLLVAGQSSTVGQLGSEPKTILYYQQDDGSFAIDQTLSIDNVGISFTQWGDYDQDGDLDLFLAGFKANQDVVAQVYDNLEGLENANKAPNAPYLLDDSNINDNKVRLTWSAPVDPNNPNGGATPEEGLRYQIQIGSQEESNEHAISTGHYGVGEIGTFNRTEKTIRNIPEGNYGWRGRAIDHGYAVSNWSNTDYFYIDITAPAIDTIRTNYVSDDQIILIVKFKEDFYLDLNSDPTILVTHPDTPDLDNDGVYDSLSVEKQSFNGDEWTGVLILPDNYSGKAIQVHVSGAQDDRQNKMTTTSVFKTPASIISQYGGTAISKDGNVSVLLPQNAVSGDVSLSITGWNWFPDITLPLVDPDDLERRTYLVSDIYDIKPFDVSLNKPGILRIAYSDSICSIISNGYQYYDMNKSTCDSLGGNWIFIADSGLVPFIGIEDTTIPGGVMPIQILGGSEITINNNPYLQIQIDALGTYGVFISQDSLLYSDSLDIEKVVCQPRIFSPGGSGSVFEFTQTNILYDLDEVEDVTARIFNLSGRLKRTIKPEIANQAGHQVMNWDGKDTNGDVVPSGLYIVT